MRVTRVVCWSKDAFDTAVSVGIPTIFYRPQPHEARPTGGAVLLCHGNAQQERIGGISMPAPVTVAEASRSDDGVFRWLLSADAGPNSGLQSGVWAACLLYVLMRRQGQTHRMLLAPGDAPRLRQARRFADQLGLPDMIEPTHGLTYEEAAGRADAALLTPTGPCDPWPAHVAAATGLPIVSTEVAEMQGSGFVSETMLPRHITRAMLRLVESPERGEPSSDYGVDRVRQRWNEAVNAGGIGATSDVVAVAS